MRRDAASADAEEEGTPVAPGAGRRLLVGRVRERLGSLAARGGAAAGRLADSARDQLATGTLVKQGLAARERGNLEAAFALLREARDQAPEDARVARELWAVALDCARTSEAWPAAELLVTSHARAGELELAAQHWRELVAAEPEVRLTPALLLRLVPVLRQWRADADAAARAAAEAPAERAAGARAGGAGDEEEGPEALAAAAREEAEALLLRALRHTAEAGEAGLTPGLGLRLFEEARELDPASARAGAHVALASPDLHEAKRERVEAWLQAEPNEAGPHPAGPHEPGEDEAGPEAGAEPGLEPGLEAGPKGGALEVREASRVERGDDALRVALRGGRRARVALGSVAAVAVARIAGEGAEPFVVIDLLLASSREGARPRCVLRLRSDADGEHAEGPEEGTSEEARRGFLTWLLERSRALPLPDPDAALGLRLPDYPSVAAYEREVLHAKLAGAAPAQRRGAQELGAPTGSPSR